MRIKLAAGVLAATWTLQAQAPADPSYRALRDAAPSETWRVENIELKRDVGTITLSSGQITFLTPVMNRVTMGVFSGEGRLRLKPATPIESSYLAKLTGKAEVDEAFDSGAFYFTDQTYDEIRGRAQAVALDARAAAVLRDFRRRFRRDVENSRSLIEGLFSEENAVNLEAALLSELYDPAESGSFRL